MAFDKNWHKFREKMRRWDEKNVLDYAVKEATKKLEKDMRTSYAGRMKLQGWSVSDIADITGVSIEEIEKMETWENFLIRTASE